MNYKNYIKFILLFFLLIIIGIQYSCSDKTNQKKQSKKTTDIQLFAAGGTMLPCIEICDSFGTKIAKNFAASGAIARQINAGADADIYLSANKQWIDFLNGNKLLINSSISEIAGNSLVIICKKNKYLNLEFSNKFDIKKAITNNIAIGDPKYVPVGKYAKQVLDSLNWYNLIQNKIILAKDVTAVLHYVELGECDWGIVYYTEALKSDKVRIAYSIPQKYYDSIIFYIARLNDDPKTKELYQYFKSTKAKEILNKYGFTTKN